MNLIYMLIAIIFFAECHGLENSTLECGRKEISLTYLNVALEMITKVKENFPSSATNKVHSNPLDCEDLKHLGHDENGIYNIWPKNRLLEETSIKVYCDMKTDGGGWTLLQRRGDFGFPKDYFFREWISYRSGFGELDKEFWLGNDNIFALTNQKLYSVRFDLMDINGEKRYALYDRFWIDDELNYYTLHITDYSGNAGDSMISVHKNQKFSTKDRDNDDHSSNCAEAYKGGWWYGACHHSNLNGLNHRGKHTSYADGINWKDFRFHNESLASTEIKIRSLMSRKPLAINSEMKPELEINEKVHLTPEISKTPIE